MKIEKFEEIQAWQLERELTRKVYNLTKKPSAAIRGFIKYLKEYEKRKHTNSEP